jgi:SseB protein N-terminal domain
MIIATDSNTADKHAADRSDAADSHNATDRHNTATAVASEHGLQAGATTSTIVERALAAAVRDPARIGDLLDQLKTARLWLPLPDDGEPVIKGTAVTLPTVSYLGSEFVPAYSSAELLQQLAQPDGTVPSAPAMPHAVVRAADLARLLPPAIGIALNAGAPQSVPVYPEGVAYLAAQDIQEERGQVSIGPLPTAPDALLARIGSALADVSPASQAAAAWLSVPAGGEGLLISVTLDDPADGDARDAVVSALEQAAAGSAPPEASFPIDVTFPGEGDADQIDEWISAFATPFYRR